MIAGVSKPLLADLFLLNFTEKTANATDNSKVEKVLHFLLNEYQCKRVSYLTRHGIKIGIRYTFGDLSFCDFYDEANTKAFTGTNEILN